jgi:cytoskeleton protein RodZ
MNQEQKILKDTDENLPLVDICDEIDNLGPGRILKDAREACGLSQQQVAEKLNFRVSLVQNIEIDKFDLTLPEAFNRGYIKNYAKVVNISQEDILASYEQLSVAKLKCAELQSFSKGTEKLAEHNMLMWITYLILATLVTATVVWWLQTPSAQPESLITDTLEVSASKNNSNDEETRTEIDSVNSVNNELSIDLDTEIAGELPNELPSTVITDVNTDVTNALVNNDLIQSDVELNKEQPLSVTQEQTPQVNLNNTADSELSAPIANVVFTFSGDCWVNIYDATGERIAWGVKKSGYIMKISGQEPFSVTLGKPELVQIDYNDVSVDMSTFNAGNIAKFSLPLAP